LHHHLKKIKIHVLLLFVFFSLQLIIDIGTPFGANGVNAPYQFNQMNPYPQPFVSQQYNMSPPPPNYNQSAARFCSACGMVRQDLSMKFCPSCGHSFG